MINDCEEYRFHTPKVGMLIGPHCQQRQFKRIRCHFLIIFHNEPLTKNIDFGILISVQKQR